MWASKVCHIWESLLKFFHNIISMLLKLFITRFHGKTSFCKINSGWGADLLLMRYFILKFIFFGKETFKVFESLVSWIKFTSPIRIRMHVWGHNNKVNIKVLNRLYKLFFVYQIKSIDDKTVLSSRAKSKRIINNYNSFFFTNFSNWNTSI